MSLDDTPTPPGGALPHPAAINYVAGFLLVGLAWGFTTPFLRRAARDHRPPPHPLLEREDVRASAVKRRVYGGVFAVLDLLRNPRYAVPLLLNLTGSVWFFLLIGKAGTSSAFLLCLLPCRFVVLSFCSGACSPPPAWSAGLALSNLPTFCLSPPLPPLPPPPFACLSPLSLACLQPWVLSTS